MGDSPLISIIMPALNAKATIAEAIESVLEQSYSNWELWVIDNGSSDGTFAEVQNLRDDRIHLLLEKKRGVSNARNTGLNHANGEYICFLDADDTMPKEALSSRVELFQTNKNLQFVDGTVLKFNSNDVFYQPSFRGEVLTELARMNSSCFFGNTWMIRGPVTARFREELTHCEDLMFYIEQEHVGSYDFTKEPVLCYRQGANSAMSNLDGLESGYKSCIQIMRSNPELVSFSEVFRIKARSIMFRSFLKKGRPFRAIISWLRFFS